MLFLAKIWAGTAEVHNNFVISFQSTPPPEQPVRGQVRQNSVTVYLLNPEAMKCWFMTNTLSTSRDQVLHPRDICSTELQTCSTVAFLVCCFFFQTTLVFTKCLVWKIFQYFQALFCSFLGRWLNIASGKGMKIYSGIVLRSANVKKKSLRK